jgi:hypothetical protein
MIMGPPGQTHHLQLKDRTGGENVVIRRAARNQCMYGARKNSQMGYSQNHTGIDGKIFGTGERRDPRTPSEKPTGGFGRFWVVSELMRWEN